MTIAGEITILRTLTTHELRDRYREVFGETSRSGNKDYLFRKIAWKIQEKAYGGLSERAKRRAFEIADENDLRTRPPRGYSRMLEDQLATGTAAPPADVEAAIAWDPRLPMPGAALTKEVRHA